MDQRRTKTPQLRHRGDLNSIPSFSSTLLDKIYNSIGENDALSHGKAPDPFAPVTALKRSTTVNHNYYYDKPSFPAAPVTNRAASRPRRGLRLPSTSSSSDNSSYGGFSSSEPESAAKHCRNLRPIRTSGAGAGSPVAVVVEEEKKKTSSIRRKIREFGKSPAPASPGGRLAGFLNSLFSARSPRKVKSGEESACSSASSYSRSCLSSKTTSSMGRRTALTSEKRSVRFDMTVRAVERGDEEVWSQSSESSSDLFELENLTELGRGGYRDELPVYESTRMPYFTV